MSGLMDQSRLLSGLRQLQDTSRVLRLRVLHITSVFWLLVFGLLLMQVGELVLPKPGPVLAPIWGRKPVLTYLVLTVGSAEQLRQSGLFSEVQLQAVKEIARHEEAQLQRLERSSREIVERTDLSLLQKRQLIRWLGYNQEVRRIVRTGQVALLAELGGSEYFKLVAWAERQWKVERSLHGSVALQSGPRTYRIFATHYKSKGAYIVALPDQCLKLSNSGSNSCADRGYQPGQGYTVFMSYKNKSTAALVGEVGPWNIDDNYWASIYDPQPRRMFADLPLGLPEAQAAYFNGYNGGVDQYGRIVTAPFGIDLGDGVGADIGLEPGANDWIEVTYMWTEGWNPAAAGASSGGWVAPLETAAPNPDGSVMHEVQPGQALWSIAAAYQIDLSDLLALNGLTEKAVIQPGDKLVIKLGEPTDTPEKESHATALPSLSPTETRAIPTMKRAITTTTVDIQLSEATPTSRAPQPVADRPVDPVLAGILVLVVAGTALIVFGVLYRR